MTDNVAITAGTGTSIAADIVGGVHIQRMKIVTGADGTNGGDVTITNPFPIARTPATLGITATAVISTAVTLTLPVAGAGLFHYITYLQFDLYSSAARTGAAAAATVTAANLPGTNVWLFPTAGAIGTIDRVILGLDTPLRSTVANTVTSFTAAITTGGIWRLNVAYYTGT